MARVQKIALRLVFPTIALLAACSRVPDEGLTLAQTSSAPSAPPCTTATSASNSSGPLLSSNQVRMIEAPAGDDVVALVRDERARQATQGRQLIVYAGATWCEPCQYFHKAAAAGKLDAAFPNLTILEFDVDHDRERLTRAGYSSRLIPLFVVPDANGRPTDHKMEGSIKGDGAVEEIVPRLRAMLGS